MQTDLVNELVAEFGGKHRSLIASVLDYLDEQEPTWKLERPVDRRAYVREIMSHAVTET